MRADSTQGLEDAERLRKYIDDFSATMAERQEVLMRPILDNRLISYASEFKSSEGSAQRYVVSPIAYPAR